jgi:hypothetical protein
LPTVTRPEQRPGRRRAERAPRRSSLVRLPSFARRPSPRPVSRRLLVGGWFALVLIAAGVLVADRTPLRLAPDWLPVAAAVTVTTAYTFALGVRTGGRPLVAGGLALVLTLTAVVSGIPVLVAGAAVCTAAAGAVLGVLATTPAPRFRTVVRELLVAVAVAVVAALAADSYGAQVSLMRAGYLALALALLGAIVLVFRLGNGLQGLGTRGAVVVVGGLGLLALTLAYTEALSRWGSPQLVTGLEDAVAWVRDVAGAVPRPIEFLLGFPALAWGVSTRARRRQGWWACAFGAAGLSGVTTTLLATRLTLAEAAIGLGYSLVLGLLLGYLAIRVDAFFSGTRGRRARRAEEAAAHRPESRRTAALL